MAQHPDEPDLSLFFFLVIIAKWQSLWFCLDQQVEATILEFLTVWDVLTANPVKWIHTSILTAIPAPFPLSKQILPFG